MTRLWKRVATRLKDSQNTFVLLTIFNEVDRYVIQPIYNTKCPCQFAHVRSWSLLLNFQF